MDFRKFWILILIVGLGCKQQESEVITITKPELTAVLEHEDVQLIDVRRPEEYNQGHISGSININILDSGGFEKAAALLDKQKPVYIYCQAGKRSKKASKKLKAMGFITIYDYSDGYGSW
ncbi:rhodanese-like domain-containing protein [Flagellimonas sp. 2504JD1-5]